MDIKKIDRSISFLREMLIIQQQSLNFALSKIESLENYDEKYIRTHIRVSSFLNEFEQMEQRCVEKIQEIENCIT